MSDTRLWVSLLATVCFLAGGAAGILFAHARFEPQTEEGPYAKYHALFAEQFDLDPERAQLLRSYLAYYQADVEEIRERHTADLLSSMEPALRQKGEEYALLIQDRLLPPESREKFRRLTTERVENL